MAEQRQAKAPAGVLIIHGFSATPESVAILEKPLRALGLPVSLPLLSGHGAPSPEALRGVTFHDWMADADRAFQALAEKAEKIIVVGHSMGALISLRLAAEYADTVDSLVLAAPALRLASLLAPGRPLHFAAAPLSLVIKRWDLKPVFAGTNYLKCAGQYQWVPTDAILSLFELIGTTLPQLGSVNVPVLLLQNRRETTVLAESEAMLFKLIGTRHAEQSVIWLERSEHQIFCDCEREEAVRAVLAFVSGRLAQKPVHAGQSVCL
ncbi:MAG: alpha/beta fold hydrolase [Chlorobium sp.]|uniref:alpha/beta hydrolase n=1 Tax=Chlorobium sp. TaxID=1095 RepID=UPI0025BAA8FF|nr:alpha/beta fold hydrolase [Chlorobium sp.]MCF8384032.1 alpha/beta fold hydrolase [Chlorobium sp.]